MKYAIYGILTFFISAQSAWGLNPNEWRFSYGMVSISEYQFQREIPLWDTISIFTGTYVSPASMSMFCNDLPIDSPVGRWELLSGKRGTVNIGLWQGDELIFDIFPEEAWIERGDSYLEQPATILINSFDQLTFEAVALVQKDSVHDNTRLRSIWISAAYLPKERIIPMLGFGEFEAEVYGPEGKAQLSFRPTDSISELRTFFNSCPRSRI